MNAVLHPLVVSLSVTAVLLIATATCWSQMSPAEQRGRTFAQANCSNCHSIDKVSPSPLSIAPPFRELSQRYPVETLEEALAEGIVTGHPNMPEFRLARDQIGNFIAFLKTLER